MVLSDFYWFFLAADFKNPYTSAHTTRTKTASHDDDDDDNNDAGADDGLEISYHLPVNSSNFTRFES